MTPLAWVNEESVRQLSDEDLVDRLVEAAFTNNEMDCRRPLEVLRREALARLRQRPFCDG